MHCSPNRTWLKTAALAGLAALGCAAQADPTLSPELLDSFTRCDAGFFRQLSQIPALEQRGPIERGPEFANFRVPDRNHDDHNRLVFARPFKLGNLTVKGYQDSYSNLGWDGRYWFWGFVVQGSPARVWRALPRTLRTAMQRNPHGDWQKAERMDLRQAPRVWQAVGKERDGKVPDKDTVEHALMLSRDGKTGNSLLLCSVQGFPDAEALQQLRPDAWRQFTDPAYLARQQQLIAQILSTYTPFQAPDGDKSDAALRQQAHQTNLALKARYDAAGDTRPPAFWQAMDQMEFEWQKHLQHPTDAIVGMKQVLGKAMLHYADNSQLEEVVGLPEPRWAYLVLYGIIPQKDYFDMQSLLQITDMLTFRNTLVAPIEKRFGTLHAFPPQ